MPLAPPSPIQLIRVPATQALGVVGSVAHGALTPAAFLLNLTNVSGGDFEVGRNVTSTSGGTAVVAVVNSDTQITINTVVGAFAPGDTIDQVTGPAAQGTQVGALVGLVTFDAGATLTSSSGGTAVVDSPPAPTAGVTYLRNVVGLFTDTDTLTQTTGVNNGATATQAGELVNFLTTVSLRGLLNGRLRGNAHQDVDGDLLIEFGNSATVFDLSFTVTKDGTQPDSQYPFDVIILQPFVRVSFTNGGAAATFFRASVQALPD